jgi:acylphosphatase
MTSFQTSQGWVAGRVQGVNYRGAFKHAADRLAVTGWVRNLADGRVEFLVGGSKAAVEALLKWAKEGPRFARVDDLHVECSEETLPADFQIRY